MKTAQLIDRLKKLDPNGVRLVMLEHREDDGFVECGAVRTRRLALDESNEDYGEPWDAASKLKSQLFIVLFD